MTKEEYDKYKKVVAELDGYDICDEFNLGTYELRDEKKLLEIVLMHYFKNQDESEEKDKEIERLNNIINELEKDIEEYFKKEYPDRKLENYNLKNCTYDYALVILGKLKELKGKNND